MKRIEILWDERDECTLRQLALAFAGVEALLHGRDVSAEAQVQRQAVAQESRLLADAVRAQLGAADRPERERELSLKGSERVYGIANGAPAKSTDVYVHRDEARRYARARQRYSVGRPPPACLLDGARDAHETTAPVGAIDPLLLGAYLELLCKAAPSSYLTANGKPKVAPLHQAMVKVLDKRGIEDPGFGTSYNRIRPILEKALATLNARTRPELRKKNLDLGSDE
jgi:hypothetical protein